VTRLLLYAGLALGVCAGVLGGGWVLFPAEEARRGLVVAVAVALPLQLAAFGLLLTREPGSLGLLGVWAASALVRFAAVGGVALWVTTTEGVDPMITLLALAGLLFILLLLEPWALGAMNSDRRNGTAQE
jgi:hypothetical protein